MFVQGCPDQHMANMLALYVVDEAKNKQHQELDVSSWRMSFPSDIPQQHNGYDCGVFVLM